MEEGEPAEFEEEQILCGGGRETWRHAIPGRRRPHVCVHFIHIYKLHFSLLLLPALLTTSTDQHVNGQFVSLLFHSMAGRIEEEPVAVEWTQ